MTVLEICLEILTNFFGILYPPLTIFISNKIFSNIIATLGIPQYNKTAPLSHNIGDPLMKAIMKYRFHPSIFAIKKNCNSSVSFSFSQVERHEIMKEINNLKTDKATQSTKVTANLIKESSDILHILFLETIVIAFPILFFQTP